MLRQGAPGPKMAPVRRAERRAGAARARAGAALALVAIAIVLLRAPSASAQDRPPTITGSVSGGFAKGDRLTVEMDAVSPGGWQGLREIGFDLLDGDEVLDEVVYDLGRNFLHLDGSLLIPGTAGEVSGNHLLIKAYEIVATTGGAHFVLTVPSAVIQTIPDSARFRLHAEDDLGATASATRTLNAPEAGGGVGLGELAAYLVFALAIGAIVGGIFASRRRPPQRLSVYGAVQRRLDEEGRGSSGRAR